MDISGLTFWDVFFPALVLSFICLFLGGLRMNKTFREREEARRVQSYLEKRVIVIDENGNEVERKVILAQEEAGKKK